MADKELFQLSQKVVLYNQEDGKFLVAKDSDPDAPVCKKYGVWELPGGRVDKGEKPEEVIPREIVEELGEDVQYELENATHGYVYHFPKEEEPHRVVLTTLALYKGGEIQLSDEHSEYRWVTLEEVEADDEYFPWLKEAVRGAAIHLKSAELLNDLKRSQADFENYKKRMIKDQAELSKFMIQGLVSDLVPILDNFHAAVSHVPEGEKGSPWVTGITYIEKQFEDTLVNYGVKPIDVKPGDPFDPTRHEALEHKEDKDKKDEKLTIEKVVQKGYQIGDKVIRAAKVIVR